MILDKLLQLDANPSNANTIIVAGVDSANTIDLLNARDLMPSTDDMRAEFVFTVVTAMVAAGGAASLVIQIQFSADNITYVVAGQTDSGGIAKALLIAGTQIRVPLPSFAANPNALLPRYIKATYKAITNPFTGGTFACDLVLDAQANNPVSYPAGITVAN